MLPKFPYKKEKVLSLLRDNHIEAAKAYVKGYFYKCESPLITFYWHQTSNTFVPYKMEDIKRAFLTRNMRVDDGKIKACYQFTVADWFYMEDDEFFVCAVKRNVFQRA